MTNALNLPSNSPEIGLNMIIIGMMSPSTNFSSTARKYFDFWSEVTKHLSSRSYRGLYHSAARNNPASSNQTIHRR